MSDKIKTTLSVLIAVAAMTLISCTKQDIIASTEKEEPAQNQHKVPIETALAGLQDMLDAMEQIETKAGGQSERRIIDKVSTVDPCNFLLTKSADTTSGKSSDLLYLVTFEGEKGYALLAADDRIPSDVIALVEQGTLTTEELYKYYNEEQGRTIYSSYPTTGPGIIEGEDGGGEKYLNPNTFSLYDETEGDAYVGDFVEPDNDSLTIAKLSGNRKTLNKLAINYSLQSIRDSETEQRLRIDVDDSYIETTKTETVVSRRDSVKVSPLATFAKYWHQGSPFNDYNRILHKYLFWGESHTAYAGCVPLSIAVILNYHKFPESLKYNDITINYEALQDTIISPVNKYNAAAIVKKIASDCGSLYFYDGTFTFPSRAAKFLSNNGYTNVCYSNYNTDAVLNALDDSCPVFICSVPKLGFLNYNLAEAHGWILDGYLNRAKTTTTRYYTNDVLKSESTKTEHFKMVHCNFGWGSYCSGYFISGIFDLASKEATFDNPLSKPDETTNYNWYLKTITYDNPNKNNK